MEAESAATHESGTDLNLASTADLLEARMSSEPVEKSTEETKPEVEEVEAVQEDSGNEPVEKAQDIEETSTETSEPEDTDTENKDKEPEEPEESSEQEAEPEEIELESLTELAEHFELDPESLEGLNVKIKIDGVETEVTLAELRNGYQREAVFTRNSQEVAEARKTVEAEYAEVQSERRQHIEAIDQLGWVLKQSIEGADFEGLRESDPAEYAARMEDRRQKVEHFQQLSEQRNALTQNEQALAQEQYSERLVTEDRLLLEAFPEWKDPDVRKRNSAAVTEYLSNEGFSAEELGSINDHRVIKLAEKARLYDEIKKQAPVVKKKVIKTPKFKKPKASPKTDSKVTKAAKNLKNLGNTQSVQDALLSRWS